MRFFFALILIATVLALTWASPVEVVRGSQAIDNRKTQIGTGNSADTLIDVGGIQTGVQAAVAALTQDSLFASKVV